MLLSFVTVRSIPAVSVRISCYPCKSNSSVRIPSAVGCDNNRLPARRIGDRLSQRVRSLYGHTNFKANICFVACAEYVNFVHRPQLLQRADVRVRYGDIEHGVVATLSARQIDECLLHRATVRFHKAAGAELCATEIAGNDRRDITDPAVREHRQYRSPGGAVRFTVVAHTDAIGAPGRTKHERPAVVRGVREFDVHFVNERVRFIG